MEINKLPKRNTFKNRLPISESEPEHELKYQLLKLGLRPEQQYPINGFFVDFAFPEAKLAIEYDGFHHLKEGQFEKDLDRQVIIENAGWKVWRVGKHYAGGFFVSWDNEVPLEMRFIDNEDAIKFIAEEVKKFLPLIGKRFWEHVTGEDQSQGFRPIWSGNLGKE